MKGLRPASAPAVGAPGLLSKPFQPRAITQKQSPLSPEETRSFIFRASGSTRAPCLRLYPQIKVTSQRHKASGLIRKYSEFTVIFFICLCKQHLSPRQSPPYFKMSHSPIKTQSKAGVTEEFMTQGSKFFLGFQGK